MAFGRWIIVALMGVALRVALLPLAPMGGFVIDHAQFVRWGLLAADRGPAAVYEQVAAAGTVRTWIPRTRSFSTAPRSARELGLCNYPPGSVYLLWVSGLAFGALSPDRVINTTLSHACYSSWSFASDLLLALGCAALVRRYRGPGTAFGVFTAVLLLPPFWYDAFIWGQTDTRFLAAAVWLLWATLTQRWLLAGVLFGIAASLKPQALLLAPWWAYVIVTARPRWKAAGSLVLGLAVLLLIALPFQLQSGWTWLRASYAGNLEWGNAKTLTAFNVWYLDALLTDSIDAGDRLLGLTRDTWGRGLLALALGLGFLALLWRWRRHPHAWLLWAALSLLAVVMLPTRVHERYLLLPLPFLLCAAAMHRRLRAATVALVIVASAQLAWPLWIDAGVGFWTGEIEPKLRQEYERMLATQPAARLMAPGFERFAEPARVEYDLRRRRSVVFEWLFTLAALTATAAIAHGCVALRPADVPSVLPRPMDQQRTET